jgi:hypothetical protein
VEGGCSSWQRTAGEKGGVQPVPGRLSKAENPRRGLAAARRTTVTKYTSNVLVIYFVVYCINIGVPGYLNYCNQKKNAQFFYFFFAPPGYGLGR